MRHRHVDVLFDSSASSHGSICFLLSFSSGSGCGLNARLKALLMALGSYIDHLPESYCCQRYESRRNRSLEEMEVLTATYRLRYRVAGLEACSDSSKQVYLSIVVPGPQPSSLLHQEVSNSKHGAPRSAASADVSSDLLPCLRKGEPPTHSFHFLPFPFPRIHPSELQPSSTSLLFSLKPHPCPLHLFSPL